MSEQINSIKHMFLFYGFLKSPLTTKNIVSLLLRGKTKDEIYEIGCDIVNCCKWGNK
tara:strand:- start:1127 stop:1297 length:171 start_codon:yes stop_codon:yes gene_type:complete